MAANKITKVCETCGVSFLSYKSVLARNCSWTCRFHRTPEQRFWEKVRKTDSCWLWTGTTNGVGYGKLQMGSHDSVGAHRFSWELANRRKAPVGKVVMHSCDNRRCVNPAHLSLGTQGDNMADRDKKGRHWAQRGTRHGQSKLTESDVLAIRAAAGTQKEIGQRFGVSQSVICHIRRRQAWGWL